MLPYDEKSPTRVLAATLYYQIENKYFSEKTTRATIATKFMVTTAQLHKPITGVDYLSGPHAYTKKRKATATVSHPPTKKSKDKEDTFSSSSSSNDLPPGL